MCLTGWSPRSLEAAGCHLWISQVGHACKRPDLCHPKVQEAPQVGAARPDFRKQKQKKLLGQMSEMREEETKRQRGRGKTYCFICLFHGLFGVHCLGACCCLLDGYAWRRRSLCSHLHRQTPVWKALDPLQERVLLDKRILLVNQRVLVEPFPNEFLARTEAELDEIGIDSSLADDFRYALFQRSNRILWGNLNFVRAVEVLSFRFVVLKRRASGNESIQEGARKRTLEPV